MKCPNCFKRMTHKEIYTGLEQYRDYEIPMEDYELFDALSIAIAALDPILKREEE